MRTLPSSRSLLTAVVLSAAAAATTPAAAQQSAATAPARPAVPPAAAAAAAPAPRDVAVYRFTAPRHTGLPSQVTIADSAGVLVASYRLPGDRGPRPMELSQVGTDLVLQAETPAGVLTLQLHEQTDPATAVPVSGRWWLGEQGGVLRGRTVR